jgi:hypothetical protein
MDGFLRKRFGLLVAMAAAALFAGPVGRATADFQFTLENVNFVTFPGFTNDAGTLTGTFSTNNAISMLTALNITASAKSGITSPVTESFAGFNYTLADTQSPHLVNTQDFVSIALTSSAGSLTLVFAIPPGLTGTNSTTPIMANDSHETEGGFTRYVGPGTVGDLPEVVLGSAQNTPAAATPEPATMMSLASGVVCLVGYGWRRKRAPV